MILQALCEYYERKSADPESGIAPIGFEWKPLPFLIVIDKEGKFIKLQDTRENKNKKLVAKLFLVPQSQGRSGSASWKTTFLLWDHYGYVLGFPKGGAKKDRKKLFEMITALLKTVPAEKQDKIASLRSKTDENFFEQLLSVEELDSVLHELDAFQSEFPAKEFNKTKKDFSDLKKATEDSVKQRGTFADKVNALPEDLKQEEEIHAVLQFYENQEYQNVFGDDLWEECATINGANLSFRLEGKTEPVTSNPHVKEYQKQLASVPEDPDAEKSLCLVSGNMDYVKRVHDPTPIAGGQATGKLIGFQRQSGFDSYGKDQAFNAPVGMYAQAAYTTAFNTLAKSQNNKVLLGGMTILFWSEKENELEQAFPFLIVKAKDDPDRNTEAVKQLYQSISFGKLSTEGKTRFFILGVSPNAARISVRFWVNDSVDQIARNFKMHFDDLAIVAGEKDLEFFALETMLRHTALDYKLDNVAPNLQGQVVESILKALPYPKSLLYATVRRIRAEQSKKINNKLVLNVTRIRAAIIKACINRDNRFYNKHKEEITVSLDVSNQTPAYLLGRLFAVLEKIQYQALKIETIRERYYGAFSSTPVTVYPQLMKLKNHHLAKLKKGSAIYYENLIGEIVDGLDGSGNIPRQFNLEEQGKFAVGYYHQRQNLYKKEDKPTESTEEASNE
ncbi:MAG: type I-C CRISPR-associated protein Cas8c/Csd1 [Fibrobacteraceae bacterium]|nr:type I-C CRISPR-associated protein Cas8c/Csd1 [Fibrobacteraceae bacterium]